MEKLKSQTRSTRGACDNSREFVENFADWSVQVEREELQVGGLFGFGRVHEQLARVGGHQAAQQQGQCG